MSCTVDNISTVILANSRMHGWLFCVALRLKGLAVFRQLIN